MKKAVLVLFDFDGTITKKDSLIDFIRFYKGTVGMIIGLFVLSPMLIAYKLKMIRNDKAKQRMLKYFFSGMDIKDFKKITKDYSLECIDSIVRPKALERIKWHQIQGHKVVVVSASICCWLEPWCKENKLELLCTKMEVIDGKITGRFQEQNCYGIEKVNQIRKYYNINDYDEIYAYGDSSGDKEMLNIADNEKRFFRLF